MNDFDPNASLNLEMADGSTIEMNRYNSSLFTFVGQNATRNHVYVQYNEGEQAMGSYIFACSPVFKQLAQFMLVNDFPAVINQNMVPSGDEEAYQLMIDKEVSEDEGVSDFFPDDWK